MDRLYMMVGTISVSLAGVISQIKVNPGTIEAVGKWPITIALIALAALSVYLMYRQAENSRKSLDKASSLSHESSLAASKALTELTAELKQRPCVRDPNND